jgi:hypothetical protein
MADPEPTTAQQDKPELFEDELIEDVREMFQHDLRCRAIDIRAIRVLSELLGRFGEFTRSDDQDLTERRVHTSLQVLATRLAQPHR